MKTCKLKKINVAERFLCTARMARVEDFLVCRNTEAEGRSEPAH